MSWLRCWLCLLWMAAPCLAEDWQATCPKRCDCRYYNNKREVECQAAGFSTMPSRLSDTVQVLDLTNNNIRSLDRDIFLKMNLINLHKLSLSSNKIDYVDKDAFRKLVLLMDLDLSQNHISRLHPDTFTGMVKMRKLILSGNFLTRLEYHQFPHLPNLHRLEIDNCNISYIHNEAFGNLQNIYTVSLKGNRLHVLNPELFTSLPSLRSVELMENLWMCDCELRPFVRWFQDRGLGEDQVSCYLPKRLTGEKLSSLSQDELACPPRVIIPQSEVSINVGGNATLSCGAEGEPLPSMTWILNGRVLNDGTELSFPVDDAEEVDVRFEIQAELRDSILWSNLTVIQIGEDFMLRGYDQNSPFKCVVENAAKNVENNITLVIGTFRDSPIITGGYMDIYVIIAVVAVFCLFLMIIVLLCVCYFKRRQSNPKQNKLNGALNGDQKAFLEKNNIVIVNPIEKPPRSSDVYQKVPQSDIELTDLTRGGHKNFEEMDYPEEKLGRTRSPLSTLDEEEFEKSTQKLINESVASSTPVDFSLQYPDLLDNLKYSRGVSPTQLSYHSLVNPLYSPSPDWRYSFASYPLEFTANRNPHATLSRPGYVTLPRRPRTSSVASAPPVSNRALSPSEANPIYDTLGPRVTADGTSRTDLNKVLSPRATGLKDASFSSDTSSTLPLHYVPIIEDFPLDDSFMSTSTDWSGSKLNGTLPLLAKDWPGPKSHRTLPKHMGSRSRYTPTSSKDFTSLVKSNNPFREKILTKDGIKHSSLTNPFELAIQRESQSPCPQFESPTAILNGHSPKKVPPKPLPKPAKRLSISSTSSDTPLTKAIVVRQSYQDEGPDGTEV